jgi:tetratricopeptide (TPR) repeat protein
MEKPADAQPYFEAALKLNPKSAAAELGLARALARQNQLPAAEPHFRAAAQDQEYRDALLELAAADEKAGRADDAIAIYQQFPDNPAAQERLGELLIETQHFDQAIPRLERAVADSPTVANRLALATAYRMTKAFDKQNDQLAKAVATEPNNYDLHMIYGRALRDERQLARAAGEFSAAAKLKPDAPQAWNELANALIVNEDYAPGLAALDKVKALGANSPGAEYLRAITLDRIHQKPQAVESYKLFLEMAQGKFPDQEFAARQRIRIIETELHGR